MDWMKNIVVNLQAKGSATVLIALITAITVLGVFAEGVLAIAALILLFAFTIIVGGGLIQKIGKDHD